MVMDFRISSNKDLYIQNCTRPPAPHPQSVHQRSPMLSLILFTGLGFGLFALCLVGLTWAIRSGQLDDLETPALRMLNDDDTPQTKDSAP